MIATDFLIDLLGGLGRVLLRTCPFTIMFKTAIRSDDNSSLRLFAKIKLKVKNRICHSIVMNDQLTMKYEVEMLNLNILKLHMRDYFTALFFHLF